MLARSKADYASGMAALAGKSVPLREPIKKVEWAESKEQLASIGKDKPEYTRAQTLLKSMAAQDKKNADFWAAEVAKGKVQLRKQFAENLEQRFIDHRMNADVTVSGPQNTTLRIKYVLASKVSANDLAKSGIIEQAESAGFKVVQFTDGYTSTWTWKLNQ